MATYVTKKKRCPTCGDVKPRTPECWMRDCTRADGLSWECRACFLPRRRLENARALARNWALILGHWGRACSRCYSPERLHLHHDKIAPYLYPKPLQASGGTLYCAIVAAHRRTGIWPGGFTLLCEPCHKASHVEYRRESLAEWVRVKGYVVEE